MHVMKGNVNSNPNVGLFGYDVGSVILFGEKIRSKQQALFEDALGKPLKRARVAGTNLPGVFLVGNKNALLVPKIIFDSELKVLDDLKVKYTIMETESTALGNNIACNDYGAIISTEFSDEEVDFIRNTLGVEVVQMDIAGLSTPGALIITHGKHAIVHKDATDAEAKIIEKTLKVTVAPATVNLGSPYLNAGILHSEHGFIIGDLSGGPEIVHIDEALGYHATEDEE